jgi:outer membrane protein assembly factor BamA
VRAVELTAGYEWLDIGTDADDVTAAGLDAGAAPGLGEDLGYDVLRTGLAVDTRPAPGYATHGTLARVGYSRYAARSAEPFGFDEVEIETAHLVPLLREQYVLAFHALATFTSADDGHQVPVPLMPFLGSGSTLRGFANRRFYDTNRILLTGEYRWRPSRYLDMAVFLDAGQVGPDAERFRLSDFRTSWGLGVRLHGPTFNVFRVELARSREHWNLVFAASQPF